MDEKEIQVAVDELNRAATAKGLKKVDTQAYFKPFVQPSLYINYEDKTKAVYSNAAYEFFRGESIGECFDKAYAWLAALPSLEETKFRQFMKQVAATIELGKDNGIDIEFVNPLAEMMKRLSGNALAPPPPAPEPAPEDAEPETIDIPF